LSIGVATGREKVRAVLGAARSGMVNALVIERLVARLMLEHLEGASDTAGGDP
jgi:DNA-binding transcriptional regulator LsrR (DeoR family)